MALVDIFKFPMEDYMIPLSMACVLLLLMYRNDRQTWISVDIICTIMFGIFNGLSTSMLAMEVTGELDETSKLLCSVFGFALLGTVVVWILTMETYDGTVPITLLTARVFSYAVILMAQLYTIFGTTKGKKNIDWSDKSIYFGLCGTAAALLGNFYFLMRSHDFSSYPQYHIKINEFLKVDAMLSLLFALVFLAFPDLVLKHFFPNLKTTNCVQLHLLRCTGALILNYFIISIQAPGFLHERDKRSHFTGRIVAHLLMFVPFIWGAVYKSQFTLHQIEWALLVTLPIVINAVLGYLAGGTIMYRFQSYKAATYSSKSD